MIPAYGPLAQLHDALLLRSLDFSSLTSTCVTQLILAHLQKNPSKPSGKGLLWELSSLPRCLWKESCKESRARRKARITETQEAALNHHPYDPPHYSQAVFTNLQLLNPWLERSQWMPSANTPAVARIAKTQNTWYEPSVVGVQHFFLLWTMST